MKLKKKLKLEQDEEMKEVKELNGKDVDKQEDNLNSEDVGQLLKSYEATLSSTDQRIYESLKLCALKGIPMEPMPLFGEELHTDAASARVSNPLQAHSIRANAILINLDEQKAFQTALQYDSICDTETGDFYDMRFLLPLLCHILDEKNICNEFKVISNGWIHFILRGMCLENVVLRRCSFLAFQRLIFNLQREKEFRKNDNKLWLQILIGIKEGVGVLGECKISNLMSTWLIAALEVLKQPSHPLYRKIISAILAKPYIEMTSIPDFVTFYNTSDGKRESRDWILNVFFYGMRKKDDWDIMEKLPAIKFLCSSFEFEKVQTRKTILKILTRLSKVPEVALELIVKYSIPLWISNITTSSNAIMKDLENFYRVLYNSNKSIMSTNDSESKSRDVLLTYISRKNNWKEPENNMDTIIDANDVVDEV